MKKFFFKFLPLVVAPSLVFGFFLIKTFSGKVPAPADTLVGLYHPWRDLTIDGYNPGKFPAKNPLITDPVLQIIPWKSIVINDFKKGQWPLWNPYSFSGQPLLANAQSSPLAISNILFIILPFKIAWAISVILPLLLTSLFTYLLLTSLNFSKIASIFGASILPFGGFYVAWLTWSTVTTTAMWLPAILLVIVKIFQKITPLRFLILVFVLSQVLFSGHLQTGLYVFLTSLIFAVWQHFKSKARFAFLWVLTAFILGVIIAAPQLLPTVEFLKFSARELDQAYYPGRKDWFLPLAHLVQLVAPDFFGNPATYNYWGVWNWAEFVSFIGIVPLGFVLLSIFSKNKKLVIFFILIAVSLLLITKNPFSLAPYTFKLPFFASMQPSRALLLLDFSLVVLAAAGLDQFLRLRTAKKVIWPAVLIFLVILVLVLFTIVFGQNFPKEFAFDTTRVALRNLALPLVAAGVFLIICFLRLLSAPKAVLILGIFLMSLFELYRFTFKFTPFSKLSWLFPETKTTAFLSEEKRPFRILATDRRIFHGYTSAFYQIEAVGGCVPVYLKDYAKLVTVWQSQRVIEPGSFNRIINPDNYASKFAEFTITIIYLLNVIDNKSSWEGIFIFIDFGFAFL